jgi:hypothetical protein
MNGFTDFFQWLPNIALGLLAFIIALAVWVVWRTIAPAAPGISLGYYEVVGRYGGQKLLKRIRGTLVDATALFLSPEVESAFLDELNADLKELMSRAGNSPDLKNLVDRLENGEASIRDYCRIIVTREKLFTKHVIVQYGHVDKPLNAYASFDPQSKFTLGFGFLLQGVITGRIYTLPHPWELHRIGKVSVHLFIPDAPEQEQAAEPPDYLAKLALYAPATVELKSVIKAKDELLKEKERELIKAGHERAASATRTDALLTAIQGFTTKLKPEEAVAGKGFDLMDFITLALPTLLGYVIADSAKASPIVGVFFGLFIGAFFVFRRR